MKIIFRPGFLVMLLLLVTIFASTSRAQMTQDESTVPYKSITPRVESTIDRTAIIALRHISEARSDIHRKALTHARREVAEAARLMETIRDDLSTSTAKNLIRIARKHIEYEPAQQIMHDIPPISASLEQISVYLPIDKAKLHLDRAKRYLEKNDKREAAKQLVLADRSLIIIEVELPLLKSQRYITKADGYLAAKNAKKADEALQAAERRAMALFTGMNSPLFQAKQNLWLAFRNYSTASRADAMTYLEKARNFLDRATASGSAKGKEEAGKLSQEVAQLEKTLAGEGKAAESLLKAVWEKSEALAERSAAYLAADIAEEETTLKGENSLIEARLHVAYAETYQMTTMEPDKAVRELDTASSYLRKAAKNRLSDAKTHKKMIGLEKALMEIKADVKESNAVVQERYESIKEELNSLIQEL